MRERTMAPYIGVTVCRSDGVQEYTLNNATVVNGPRIEQSPDNKGRIYRKLDLNDVKALDWRKKLGAKVMASFGQAEEKGTTN